jgi:phytoene synthase
MAESDTLHCEQVIAQHSRSFALASRLLARDVRTAAVATYAWCRRVDDAVDHACSPEAARRSLRQLREEVDAIDAGRPPDDPVLRAITRVIESRRMPTLYLRELLSGMEMDVDRTRYMSLDDLYLYCHRVAGVVGLMMCHVLGIADDDALPHAARLGIAMQITNICRDVEEDWRRQRCYLPDEMLTPRAIDTLHGPALNAIPSEVRRDLAGPIRALLTEAEKHYLAGDAGLIYLDRVSAWAIQTARLAYSGIGGVMAERGFDVGLGRAFVSDSRKRWLAMRALTGSLARRHPRRRDLRSPGRVLEYPELWKGFLCQRRLDAGR